MEKYILSEIFTLIPRELYTPQTGETALEEQFSLESGYVFYSYLYEKGNAVVSYALPESITKEYPQIENIYPLVVKLLHEANAIECYNKVIFHYCTTKRIAHIIICTGEELKLANSFKADSFESALYFLFLSIQQQQMNPKQCIVRVCSDIEPQQEETIKRFFNGVETHNLDNLIQQ